MDPYRVLLVDDEEDIRVGISRKMDWAGLGFSLVGEAENGQDALEMAEQLRPDVVLTDIKMPFMDGLELCRILTQRLPAAKFVVFSGFDDFEYAKQAIRMNVSEYILKPINAPELSEVLRKLRDQLDTERAQRQDLEILRSRYEESLPVLRELFYAHLLEGRIPAGQVYDRAARLDLDLSGSSWAAALTHFDVPQAQRELLSLSVQQLLDENLGAGTCCAKVFLYNDAIAILASFPQAEAPIYDLIEELDRACKLAKSYLDLEPGAEARLAFDENDERELTGAVKLGGEEDIRAAVDRLADKLRRAGLALSQCHLFFLELLTCLLKLPREADLELEAVFGAGFTGAVQITDFSSPEELGTWCLARCLRIRELIGRQRTDSAWRTVEKAKAFIAGHYAESELSVEKLCEHLHLSPAYFSTLFKRETGMSFIAYVTVVRMEKAAELLRGTEDKTYRIAEQTGYLDPNYFSYVFKKHFGVSPTKFRAG